MPPRIASDPKPLSSRTILPLKRLLNSSSPRRITQQAPKTTRVIRPSPLPKAIAPIEGQELHPFLRCAVITIMVLYPKTTWEEVEKKTGVKAESARTLWRRTKARSQESMELYTMLEHCQPLNRAGRTPNIKQGSKESVEIRHALVSNPYLTFTEVGELYGWNLARSVLENIAYNHVCWRYPRPIVRKIQQNKCYLDGINMLDRTSFSHWGIDKCKKGAIFIFCDESYLNFGGVRTISASISPLN